MNITTAIHSLSDYRRILIDANDGPYSERKLVVEYTNGALDSSFELGAFIIFESMAAHVESYIGNKAGHPYFPYLVVEDFVRTFFPDFVISDENIIALCELSLNSLNPGVHLVHILEKMRDNKYVVNEYEDVYEFYNRNLVYFESLSKYNRDYTFVFDGAKRQLQDLFKGDEGVSLRTWCEHLLNIAQTLHNEKWKSFLFDKDENTRKTKIQALMERTGLPFIYNNRDQYYCDERLEKVEQRVLLRAVHDVFRVFNGNLDGCSMKSFCEISDPLFIPSDKDLPLVDGRCDSAPWERCKDPKLCAFSKLWHKWGLEKYFPINSNN
jgi:hypothetical protein